MAKKNKVKAKDREKDVTKIIARPHEVRNIADTAEEWIKLGGANINISRIAPNFIDGLKPVGLRTIYALHVNPNHGTKFLKVQRVGGDTMAFHPHGDSSIFDTVYSMGQPWAKNICYIDSQGNFGNVSGDEPAAPRYPEAKLSAAAQYIFFSDLKDSNVPMRPSYDGQNMEPDYLPARIPTVLCNPQFSGIGIGVAANIPPFNPGEVIDATIKLIKNPDAKILLIPDSPSGCNIIDDGQFQKINDIGDDCTITMQATYEIDYVENVISITSLPLQVTSAQVTDEIIKLRKAAANGKKGSGKPEPIADLIEITDESTTRDLRLNFHLKSTANPDDFIDYILKKKTYLRKSYSVEIRVIDNFRPRVWGTKKLLLEWIEYRRECVRAIYNKKLMDVVGEHHMNEVYLMVFSENNSKKTMDIAKTSQDREEMVKRFMDTYKISSLQAQTLSRMGYFQHTKKAYEEYKQKKIDTEKLIKEYEAIISSDEAVDKIIINQMNECKKKFCGPRRSGIIKKDKAEIKIPNTMHLVGISRDGFIKKIPIGPSIGMVGNVSQIMITPINNRDNLMIFDSTGRLSRVGVSSLPDMEYDDKGVELARYFSLGGEPVAVINESYLKGESGDMIIITENGIAKRTSAKEFNKIKDYKEVINLVDDDKLISAIPCGDDEEFIIYTNFGDGVRIHTNDIKRQSRTARGLSLISLKKGEKVAGIDFVEDNCDKLLYVTSAGRLKMSEEKYFPLMKRNDEPISLIALDPNEYLVGVGFVNKKDNVMVYRKKGEPVKIDLKDVPVTSRAAKAEKMVKTPSGDIVTGFRVARK